MVDKTLPQIHLQSSGPDDLSTIARQIIKFGKDIPVWLFEGEMGAGKTTLIKAICYEFGVEEMVNSPTFSIVNEYICMEGETIYHFDFYRIEDEIEAMDIGVEEYFDSGNYCLVEWPSKISRIIPESFLKIDITIKDREQRVIEVTRYD